MQCKICGKDNPPEARFCADCGAALVDIVEPHVAAVPTPIPTLPVVAVEHSGFWIRLGAAVVDSIIIGVAISIIGAICTRMVLVWGSRSFAGTVWTFMILLFLPWLNW